MRLITIWPKDPHAPKVHSIPAFWFEWEDGTLASVDDYKRVKIETERLEGSDDLTIRFSYEVS